MGMGRGLAVPGLSEIAFRRAEELRLHFEALTVVHENWEIRTTLSLGLAEFPGDGPHLDNLLAAADRALYGAKDAGRNRSVLAKPASAQGGSTRDKWPSRVSVT
jgi:diguanylate cyclase (GGDEF)-like protein